MEKEIIKEIADLREYLVKHPKPKSIKYLNEYNGLLELYRDLYGVKLIDDIFG